MPIAILDSQSTAAPASPNPWRDQLKVIDTYDIADLDLSTFEGVLIEGMVDQEHLYRHHDVIASYLDGGGLIVFSGQLFRPWLPGCGEFVPKVIRSHHDYTISIATPHPIFDGATSNTLTRRKGVAGFFARGHHPTPPNAEILLTLAGGEPVVYIDRASTNGTIVAHSGHALLGWAEPGDTAARLDAQLLRWIHAERKVT